MTVVTVKPTRKGRMLLAVLAAAGFLTCVGAYVIASGKLKNADERLQAAEKRVAESKQIAECLAQAESKYSASMAQVSFLEHSVSTRDFIPTLLKQLEQLGRSTNLKVLGVRPRIEPVQPPKPAEPEGAGAQPPGANTATAPPAKKPYDSITIDIDVEGYYSNLMSFLYRVTSFPKILEVNSVQISPVAQSKLGKPPLSMQMNVTAYIFQSEKSGSTLRIEPAGSAPPNMSERRVQ